MSLHTVTNVVDDDTFDVSPGVYWSGKNYTRIRPTGFNSPELKSHAGLVAKAALEKLILDKQIEIRDKHTESYGRLVCDVYFQGRNLASYFPRY